MEFELRDWWSRESHRGMLVVVKMENLKMVDAQAREPRGPSPRQRQRQELTWVLLRKAHHTTGCLISITFATWGLSCTIQQWISCLLIGRCCCHLWEEEGQHILFLCHGIPFLGPLMLVFEVVAYLKGWNFTALSLHFPSSFGLQSRNG